MSLSAKQNKWYWREWGAVVKTCRAAGHPQPDRHGLHIKALGRDRSHVVFSNADLDAVLAEFRAISDPANLYVQQRLAAGQKERLLWKIRQLAPEAYTAEIVLDRFNTEDVTTLDAHQLRQLRDTLQARAVARRRAPEPETAECPF